MKNSSQDCPKSQKISPEPYADFWCDAQGMVDFIVPAFSVNLKDGKCLVIASEEGAIYLTKEQAMAFYDLVSQEEHEEICGNICEKGM
jgi:hypothetical protein